MNASDAEEGKGDAVTTAGGGNSGASTASTVAVSAASGKPGDALPKIEKCRVYKIRWLVLAIFVLYSTSNAMQWIQYSIIADVVVKYYGVSTTWVDWTSMIFMILYIPFIFPGSYMLDKLVSKQKNRLKVRLKCLYMSIVPTE